MSLLKGKKALIMGVANDRSIAWGIARMVAEHGAALAFTYQGEALEKRVRPLAEQVGSDIILPCDVTDNESMDKLFSEISDEFDIGSSKLIHTPLGLYSISDEALLCEKFNFWLKVKLSNICRSI